MMAISRLTIGRVRSAILGIVAVAATASPDLARAANCMARVLADVPAEEAPEQMKSKQSGVFGPIKHVKVNKKTGKMSYCAENSYCYDSNAFEINTPCRLKLDKSPTYGDFFVYFTR